MLGARAMQILDPGRGWQIALAAEAVRGIDPIFAIEREINGLSSEHRLTVWRGEKSLAVVADIAAMPQQLAANGVVVAAMASIGPARAWGLSPAM